MSGNKKKRPVNLDLRTIRLPVGGVVSILHRVSGVFMVLAIPALLYGFQQSLAGAGAYARLHDWLQSFSGRLLLFLLLIVLAHHFLAGLRHLLLDLDIGIRRDAGRQSAWWVFAGVGAIALIGGGCLFLW